MMLTRSILFGVLAAGLASAQDVTYTTGVKEVMAPVLVTDRRGQNINGLQRSDFELSDNGKRQDIKVDTVYVPISLVVAIQANATAEPVLPKVRKIGPLFQGLVTGDQGEVAILGYDHRIQTLQDFTSDMGKIEEGLAKLRAGSRASRLNDTVVEAVRMLNTRPASRRRVLMIVGETRDVSSQAKVRETLTALQFANVNVYVVNINGVVNALLAKEGTSRPDPIPATAHAYPGGVAPLPDNARQLYGNPGNSADFVPAFVDIFRATKSIFISNPAVVYAKYTGGDEHTFVSERDLESAIGAIGNELHEQYLITYVPNNKDEGGFHQIAVTVDRPDVKIRTRPGYWIAAQN